MKSALADFAASLGALVPVAVALQDERLSSHEAEARLAERERDWRKRKARLDAAAAQAQADSALIQGQVAGAQASVDIARAVLAALGYEVRT